MADPTSAELKQYPLFSALSERELESLARMTREKKVPAGGFLTRAGDEWPYLFLVIEGRLGVLKESSEGRSLVIAELEPGELFWGLGFFQEGLPNPASVQVTQGARVYLWERAELRPLLLGNGGFTWAINQLLVKRMVHASNVIDGLAFQPVAGRLARLLMDFPGQEATGPMARSLTLDEMAARVGSSREVICRILQKFSDGGLIRITRTEFEITDRDRLAGLAHK